LIGLTSLKFLAQLKKRELIVMVLEIIIRLSCPFEIELVT